MKHSLDFLIACINTNRNYIGFELDKQYVEIAERRIQATITEGKVDALNCESDDIHKVNVSCSEYNSIGR